MVPFGPVCLSRNSAKKVEDRGRKLALGVFSIVGRNRHIAR
jgi:hypothetical protein